MFAHNGFLIRLTTRIPLFLVTRGTHSISLSGSLFCAPRFVPHTPTRPFPRFCLILVFIGQNTVGAYEFEITMIIASCAIMRSAFFSRRHSPETRARREIRSVKIVLCTSLYRTRSHVIFVRANGETTEKREKKEQKNYNKWRTFEKRRFGHANLFLLN